MTNAHTGKKGDGLIFIVPVDQVIRIYKRDPEEEESE